MTPAELEKLDELEEFIQQYVYGHGFDDPKANEAINKFAEIIHRQHVALKEMPVHNGCKDSDTCKYDYGEDGVCKITRQALADVKKIVEGCMDLMRRVENEMKEHEKIRAEAYAAGWKAAIEEAAKLAEEYGWFKDDETGLDNYSGHEIGNAIRSLPLPEVGK